VSTSGNDGGGGGHQVHYPFVHGELCVVSNLGDTVTEVRGDVTFADFKINIAFNRFFYINDFIRKFVSHEL
jgi:hypothetical protein